MRWPVKPVIYLPQENGQNFRISLIRFKRPRAAFQQDADFGSNPWIPSALSVAPESH